MEKKNIIKKALNILFPIVLGGGILWWMYRNFDFNLLRSTLNGGMNWWWMAFSLVFGVTAQLFRGLRWKQTLEPVGENPRTSTCVHAVFLSYAASLIIPRIGEITRCGVLSKYDGTSFSKSLGTVVTERIIDSLLVLLITAIVFLSQAKVFYNFFEETGTNLTEWACKFTATGYIVTALCVVALFLLLFIIMRKLTIFARFRETIKEIKEGVMSLKDVKNKTLFTLYTLGIWGSYFLHYYITFFCFDFTMGLGLNVALVSFIVGSIAVIVPTPNGMGPWHFAVKTILVLYGVQETNAETFVIIVHTIQTALIPLLGVYSLMALTKRVAK
ncbi:MAG: flippase-like domain-containing protein [Bacteroidaceae bacterium]|nr:flippase-like domain-containing protein [Bacteroidaceae bacterium]